MNTVERKLPQVKIGNHNYVADFQNGEFRQVAKPSNTISMYVLESDNGNLTFLYNNSKAKAVWPESSEAKDPNVIRVEIPMKKTDPEYFQRIKDEENEARELARLGRSIYNNPDGIHAAIPATDNKPRLLPIVNIYGTDFFLDLPRKEFRQVDNANNKIPWMALDPNHFHYSLWYNAQMKRDLRFGELQPHGSTKLILLPPLDKMIYEGVKRHEAMIKAKVEKKLKDEDDLKRQRRRQGGMRH